MQTDRHGDTNQNERDWQQKKKLPETDAAVLVYEEGVQCHANWDNE